MKLLLNFIKSVWTWFAVILGMGCYALFLIIEQTDPGDNINYVVSIPDTDFSVIARGNVDIEGGVIKVSARIGGTFESVLVVQGETVSKGQVLAIQDTGGEELEIKNASIKVKSAQLNLEEAKLNQKIDEREYNRVKLQRELDAVPEAELDRAFDSMARAELSIRRHEGNLRNVEAEMASISYTLEQRKIRAPVNGKILEVYAKPGVGASVNDVSTAFLLLPEGRSLIKVQINEADLHKIQSGQKVIISARSDPETEYNGKVDRIANIFTGHGTNTLNNNGGTIEVVITSEFLPLRIGRPVVVKFMKL